MYTCELVRGTRPNVDAILTIHKVVVNNHM